MILRLSLLTVAGLLAAGPRPVSAQLFSYDDRPRIVQSLSFGYHLIDFAYRGEEEQPVRFDFDEPAYGVVYTRPNFSVSIAYGTLTAGTGDADQRDLQLLDASLSTWGGIPLTGRSDQTKVRVFLPIALHSDYRRVSRDGDENSLTDAFNITVLGVGTGLGLETHVGPLLFEARATPIIGIALRSFGDATGAARLLDADAALHLGPFIDRFGLSLGYSFRWQTWNINASSLFPEASDDLFDYGNQQHTLRLGINW